MRHLVIPDCQVKPGVPLDHLRWAGEYAAKKKPDRIICIGDFADMSSLSSYDKGKKCYEGRSYRKDIDVTHKAMDSFLLPIQREINSPVARKGKAVPWRPTFTFFLGNHEDRITRAVELDRMLEGTISLSDLGYTERGWEVIPYLAVKRLDGIYYSHYFTSGVLGRPVTSARALLSKKHQSCVMGHVQKRDIAYDFDASGRQITSIFTGVFYQHDEAYLSPQGNKYWRGIWMLHNVVNGSFDECPIPLSYLKAKYGKV